MITFNDSPRAAASSCWRPITGNTVGLPPRNPATGFRQALAKRALKGAASLGVAALLSLAAPDAAVGPAAAHTNKLLNAAPASPVPVAIPTDLKLDLRTASRPDAAPGERTCRPDRSEAAEADPNERLQFGDMRVPRRIVETIQRAAAETGVDPVYLMALADKESSFLVEAKPSTSSAEGLFQFIAGTWLQVVKAYGAKHGLSGAAAAIVAVKGQLSIPDADARERVLALRRDPYVSALMAAEMLKRDRARIEAKTGRNLDATDSYLAHFLGADSAGRFMALLGDQPAHSAPKVFPKAARANRSLFFAREGKTVRHLTVAEVYNRIDRMMDDRVERYEAIANVPIPTAERLLEDLMRLNPSPAR